MKLLEALQTQLLYFDGGTGTVLQSLGLRPGERPEDWNRSHSAEVTALHRAYLEAGCNIIKTNTFGINRLRFGDDVAALTRAATANARRALEQTDALPQPRYIALDLGPCGRLLKPLGDLDFEDAVSLFAEVVEAGKQDADLILIETMNDAYETKAAVLAAKEHSVLPIFVTNVYDESGKLMTGADPAAMVSLLEGLGVDALGMNCSLGPVQMRRLLPELLACASVPVIVNPNAGLPRDENGVTVYDVNEAAFAEAMAEMAALGARVLGGCCGTTPAYLRAMISRTQGLSLVPVTPKDLTVCSSYTHAVRFGGRPVLIGERINPTGKRRLRQALLDGDADYLLAQASAQADAGAQVLDVNVGLPELDEPRVLTDTVCAIQEITDLPLQLDSSDPAALARALRRYNGKALVNSVNGKRESMAAIFPLVKKYGGVLIALTLDETGIPETADGRMEIARRIKTEATRYGISAKDLVFDPLALTVSADDRAACVTLECLRRIPRELGCQTSLGISNISFGLPRRELVTASFFAMAIAAGLGAAILDPTNARIMESYAAACALAGRDPHCAAYIAQMQNAPAPEAAPPAEGLSLSQAIRRGLRGAAAEAARAALRDTAPMALVNTQIVPALDEVGRGFEAKIVFLPQLLMSAEAASEAFSVVRAALAKTARPRAGKKILLATVQGDIHDIGKNIVKVLLENYGYRVLDLGRDVPPQTVLERARDEDVRLVGLSALMTTTVPAMAETIRLLHTLPDCRVMVGGAVLTPEYAAQIGADYYAKDAMESVRVANQHFQEANQDA